VGLIRMEDHKCMMIGIMKAAGDLIGMYDSSLSAVAIKARVLRISADLDYLCEECD